MYVWLNRFLRSRGGAAAVEFALLLPFFMLLFVGIIEFGNLMSQRNSVEKGLRAGAMLAARSDVPVSASQRTLISNLVKTGTTDASTPNLVPGWGDGSSSVGVTSTSFTGGGVTNLPVVRLTADVPYQPIVPGLMSFFGMDGIRMTMAHEQAHLGK